ncbi:longitudinals lacking protein, isoforms H/M/V-like [Penaeus indicus]|uniref:longitudinals lacking protein, isoforms H/M/V-like n=1 Tax=Penaeus indicus TaxID=29960 RepID=UPI00300D6D3F
MNMDSAVYWSRSSIIALLEKVREFPCIWDFESPDFKKKLLKRDCYHRICDSLRAEFVEMKDLTADHAKNKFNHLRTYHQRELKKIENMPSGSGGQQSSKWEYFNHCSYMQPGGCLYREKSNGKHPPRETEGTQPDQVEENASKKRKLHHSEFSTADTLHQDHLPGNEQFMENRPEAATRPILPCQTSHNNQTTFTTFRPRIEENQTADRYSHQTLILKGLLEDASFADVTLTAEGQSLKAHKAVLSAMSPYFKSVLQNNPSPHPIIIMPLDMQFEDLKGIIDYIYVGDITVATENLSSLFKAARVLQISGLSAIDAVGVRSSDILLSSSNAKLTSKDCSHTALSTGTNQISLKIRRNENTNILQSSHGSRKSIVSSPIAMQNLPQGKRLEQMHKGVSNLGPAVETVDPLETNNHKKPESGASSDGRTKQKSSTLADVFMLLPDEESLSVDTDGEVTEEFKEELCDSHPHQHGSEDSFDQSSSISDEKEYKTLNTVEIKEEPNC